MTDPSRRVVALILFVVFAFAACGGASSTPSVAPSVAEPSAAPSVTAETYPLDLTDDEGTAVVIPTKPERIVSLTPATTEILYAIGAGDRVVATDSGSDFPAEAVDLPDVADFAAVDVEAIVGAEADLVLAGGLGFTPPDAIAQLRDLGIPVLVIYAPSVEGVYDDVALIGEAVDEPAAAGALVTDMRTEMDAIAAVVAEGDHPKTFYEIGYTDATGEIFAPADASFVAEMVTLAGGDPITTGDPASYAIPLETLIEADPQMIVLGTNAFYMPTAEQVKARPGWDVMTAVKNDAIVPVEDTEITRPGPRLPIGLRNLATAIRPDVTLPPAP